MFARWILPAVTLAAVACDPSGPGTAPAASPRRAEPAASPRRAAPEASPDGTEEPGAAELAAGTADVRPVHPRASDDPRRTRRPPVLGGEVVERTPAPTARGDEATVRAAQRRYGPELANAPAPVLLPPADSPYFGGTLVVRPAFWAYSAADGTTTISLQASTKARVHTHLTPKAPPDRVRGVPAWITENEGIVSIAWIEGGVAYTLEVECGDPRKAACRDDGLARSIAASLVAVGGKGVVP